MPRLKANKWNVFEQIFEVLVVLVLLERQHVLDQLLQLHLPLVHVQHPHRLRLQRRRRQQQVVLLLFAVSVEAKILF